MLPEDDNGDLRPPRYSDSTNPSGKAAAWFVVVLLIVGLLVECGVFPSGT